MKNIFYISHLSMVFSTLSAMDGKSSLVIGLEVAESLQFKQEDPQARENRYKQSIGSLKANLGCVVATYIIEKHLNSLDEPNTQDLWKKYGIDVLARAEHMVIIKKTALKKSMLENSDESKEDAGKYFECAYANKLAVETFNSIKMREWFRYHQ